MGLRTAYWKVLALQGSLGWDGGGAELELSSVPERESEGFEQRSDRWPDEALEMSSGGAARPRLYLAGAARVPSLLISGLRQRAHPHQLVQGEPSSSQIAESPRAH